MNQRIKGAIDVLTGKKIAVEHWIGSVSYIGCVSCKDAVAKRIESDESRFNDYKFGASSFSWRDVEAAAMEVTKK